MRLETWDMDLEIEGKFSPEKASFDMHVDVVYGRLQLVLDMNLRMCMALCRRPSNNTFRHPTSDRESFKPSKDGKNHAS